MILQELKRRKEIQKAAIFGSRAMGNYKNGSDVDLVIYGPDVTRKHYQSTQNSTQRRTATTLLF